ncbi:MAG TPA: hypothetical protein V6D29_19230 [Leptolyngbyaceae cyanobacterium]
MPWSEKNYSALMKNLTGNVRRKAVEITNALLDEGYGKGRDRSCYRPSREVG